MPCVAHLKRATRFSILVPVYNPPLGAFQAMIASVIDQTFAGWELDSCRRRQSRPSRCAKRS